MSTWNREQLQQIVQACQENGPSIAESLNLCFDAGHRVEIGELQPWDSSEKGERLHEPGLAVTIGTTDGAFLVLIPESLPLPSWYKQPGESEQARLQTLAMEWAMNMLPEEWEGDHYSSVAVDNLYQTVLDSAPVEDAQISEWDLQVDSEQEVAEEQSDQTGAATAAQASLFWIGPVAQPPRLENFEPAANSVTGDPTESASSTESVNGNSKNSPDLESGDSASEAGNAPGFQNKREFESAMEQRTELDQSVAGLSQSASAGQLRGIGRLLNLSVTVTVRLAEKRVELGSLASLCPGSLITFNKSCEDLLDLYVNNRLYCQGEAVKIGEKFGLKINTIGAKPGRTSRVVTG